MSNVIPHNAKISSDLALQTEGDFHLINTLLNKNPRYNIPEHIRTKMVTSCSDVLANEQAPHKIKLIATKVLAELDKRNIDILKLAIPKTVIHREAKDLTDDELEAEIVKLINKNPRLKQAVDIGTTEQEIIDAA